MYQDMQDRVDLKLLLKNRPTWKKGSERHAKVFSTVASHATFLSISMWTLKGRTPDLSLRLLGSLRGSLGTYGLTQQLR